MPQSKPRPNKSQNKNQSQKIINPHDRFFRGAMSDPEVALDFLKRYLPKKIFKQIDLGSLQLMPQSFINETLREFITDVPFKVSFQGKPGYINLLIEHQRQADPLMALRLLEYSCNLFRSHIQETGERKLPIVYPIVLYTGSKPYPYSTDPWDMFADVEMAHAYFMKPYQLIDLTQMQDDDLSNDSLWMIVAMFLKYAFTRDIVSLVQKKMATMIENLVSKNKLSLFKSAVYYLFYTQQNRYSKDDLFELFQPYLSPSTQKKVMTIADSLIEQGIEQGIEKGIEKFRSLLIQQLKSRFPHQVTSHHLHLIKEAESDQLFYWIEQLGTVSSIEKVFRCF